MTATVPLKVSSAVSAVETARLALANFIDKNKAVMVGYEELLNEYNTAVHHAEHLVRENAKELEGGVGDFRISRSTSIDVAIVIETLPEDIWKKFVTSETKHKIDRKEWDRSVSSGVIDQQTALACTVEESPRITKPKTFELFTLGGGTASKKASRK